MNKIIGFSIIFFLFFTPQAWSKKIEIFVVANVNNEIITNIDLLKRFNFFVKTSNIKKLPSDERAFMLKQLVQRLVEEKIKFLEAKKLNINIPSLDLKKELNDAATFQGLESYAKLEAYLDHKGLSSVDFSKQIEARLLWRGVVNKLFSLKIKTTKLDIKEAIELYRASSSIVNLNLAEIFIPFEDVNSKKSAQSLAKKLVHEIKKGGDFFQIASQFSKSPSSKYSGKVGWVDQSSLDKEIYESLEGVSRGDVSKEIELENGYYIFKILDKKIVENIEEKDLNHIKNIIFNKKLTASSKSYLSQLKKEYYINIESDDIKKL